jgi:Ca2+-binding EF-hand superfamily protein
MGQTTSQSDDLLNFRTWQGDRVRGVIMQTRKTSPVLFLRKEDFLGLLGDQGRELAWQQVFVNMDTDFDGRVDVFEIIVTAILWSNTTWDEKVDILFSLFDLNGKSGLKSGELLLMCHATIRSIKKFATLDEEVTQPQTFRNIVDDAFSEGAAGGAHGLLSAERFSEWFTQNELAVQLRQFVDTSSSARITEAIDHDLQRPLRLLEYKLEESLAQVARILAARDRIDREARALPRPEEQEERYKIILSALDRVLFKLQKSGEIQSNELRHSLDSLAHDTLLRNGAPLEPRQRFRYEQVMKELDVLRTAFLSEIQEANKHLAKLQDLTYRLLPQGFTDGRPPSADPPHIEPDVGDPALQTRLLDRDFKQLLAKKPVDAAMTTQRAPPAGAVVGTNGTQQNGDVARMLTRGKEEEEDAAAVEEAEEDPLPIVVAFADFDPPEGSGASMLSLRVGEQLVATGQDGSGWWFGRKADGAEGWFPPSYVNLYAGDGAEVAAAS